jgi:hypothetical protein
MAAPPARPPACVVVVVGDVTAWNTLAIEWRPDYVVVRLNGEPIFDSRISDPAFAVPR